MSNLSHFRSRAGKFINRWFVKNQRYLVTILLGTIVCCGHGLAGCSPDSTIGSLTTRDLTAIPQTFSLVAGGSPLLVRLELAVDEYDSTYISRDSNPSNLIDRNRVSRFGSYRYRNDGQVDTISAPASMPTGDYSMHFSLIDFATQAPIDGVTLSIHVTNNGTTGVTTLFDSLFNDANWASSIFANTTDRENVITLQVDTSGNPGAYRESSIDWTGGPQQTVTEEEVYQSSAYDPSMGAIDKIDFKFDAQILCDALPGTNPYVSLILVQNNKSYAAFSFYSKLNAGWVAEPTFTATAQTFADDPRNTGSPDFSRNGAPIHFGYSVTSPSNTADRANSAIIGIDNWTVTVYHE